jgi:hypothetical protein
MIIYTINKIHKTITQIIGIKIIKIIHVVFLTSNYKAKDLKAVRRCLM